MINTFNVIYMFHHKAVLILNVTAQLVYAADNTFYDISLGFCKR